MHYYVFELQTGETASALVYTFENLNEARAKYFQLLSVAVGSDVPIHGAVIMDQSGFMPEPPRVFDHTATPEAE